MDDDKIIKVMVMPPPERPVSKTEKAITFLVFLALLWQILTGPAGRRRG